MSQNYAVIDLGTNTFHLLIAGPGKEGRVFEERYKERRFVKLAEEGIDKIGEKAFKRGLDTLSHFRTILTEYKVKQVMAVGTAALRTATNGPEFVHQVKNNIGLDIFLISGDREAELIGKGVTQAIPDLKESRYLIMDIGGGSVEFIIAKPGQVIWAESFPIGVAILSKVFHKSDPISSGEIDQIEAFLNSHLTNLKHVLDQYPCQILVGASGTFEVLENFIGSRKKGATYSRFESRLFAPIYEKITPTTIIDRMRIPEIPLDRAEMLISALILINCILEIAGIEEIVVSDYALKEGLLAEMMTEVL